MTTSKLMSAILLAVMSGVGLVGCGGSSGSSGSGSSSAEVQVPSLSTQHYNITRVSDDPMLDEDTGLQAMAMNLSGDVLVAVPVRVPDQGSGYMLRRWSGGVWQTVDQSLTGRQVQLAADPQGNFTIVDYDRITNALRVRHLNTGTDQVVTQINQVFDTLQHVRLAQVDNKMVILTHHWQQRDCVGECSQAQVYHDVISVSTLDSSTQTSLDTQEVWSQAVDTNSTIADVALTAQNKQINLAWIARPTNRRDVANLWTAAVHPDRPVAVQQVLSNQFALAQLKLVSAGTDQALVMVQQVLTAGGNARLYAQPILSQTAAPVGAAFISDESTEDLAMTAQQLRNGVVRVVWSKNTLSARPDGQLNTGELYQTLYRPNDQQFNVATPIAGSKVERLGSANQGQMVSLSVNRVGEQLSFLGADAPIARFSFNQNVNRPSLVEQRSPELQGIISSAPIFSAAHPESCSVAMMWRQSDQTSSADVANAKAVIGIPKVAGGYYVSVLTLPAGVVGCR